ncbi:MAG: response regulator transcription factor [Actinomycetota bacterium]|nr:response regulator transcription factor [Actinomycetota bacterium]
MTLEAAPSVLWIVEQAAPSPVPEELARMGRCHLVGRTGSLPLAVEAVRARNPDVLVVEVASVERLQQLPAAARRLAGTPLVVVCGLPAEVALVAAFSAGARAFLELPVEGEEVERAITAVLAGHIVVDPRCTEWLVGLALVGHATRASTRLTLRQSQVVGLVRSGLTNREIGRVLGLSRDTVKTHLREAMKRLGAHDRWAATELVDRLQSGEEGTSDR